MEGGRERGRERREIEAAKFPEMSDLEMFAGV